LGKHGEGGADLTPEEMAASFRELEAAEVATKRKAPLQRSHWCASTLEADAKPLVDKIRAYAGAGLDQYLCAFPKDRAAEMVERAPEQLVPAFAEPVPRSSLHWFRVAAPQTVTPPEYQTACEPPLPSPAI